MFCPQTYEKANYYVEFATMTLIADAILSSASAIIVIDESGTVIEINESTELMFGYSKEELHGASLDKLLPSTSRNKHRHHIHTFFNERPATSIMGVSRVLEGIRKNGVSFQVDIRISSFEREGKTYGVANIIDLSEKHTMSGLLASTQEIAKIGSWRVELDSNTAIWSEMVYRIHEIDVDETISVDDGLSFYVEEHRPIITNLLNKCIEEREPWDIELKILTSSGKEKWVHAIGLPIVNSEDVVVGLEGTFRDIHEDKLNRLEKESALYKLKRTEQLSKMGHWQWTISPEKIEWSEGLFELWELDPETTAPSLKEHNKYIHPEDQERFFSTLDNAVLKSEPYTVDFRIETPSGTKYIHGEGTPQLTQDGTLIGFFGTAQDLTEGRANTLRTEMLNTRLTLALDAAKTGVWELDLISDALSWDSRMFTLYGIDQKDFGGAYEVWANGLHPDDRERSEQEIEDAIAGKAAFDTRFRVTWPNGTIRHIRALAQVVTDRNGFATNMVGVNWDITDEIEQDHQLKASNERYALMTQGSSVGIWDWPDVNEDHEYWSPKFYELLGYENEELRASLENFGKLLHPDDSERCFAAIDAHFSDEAPFDLDYRLRTKSGKYRWFKGTGLVSRDDSGKPIRMVGSIQDINERVISAANLAKLNEELVQFSYRTSHDLRAPLTTSKRLAQFIEKDIEDGDLREAAANAGKIADQMARLEVLVGDLLDLARADLKSQCEETINFADVERQVIERLTWMIDESKCDVNFEIALTNDVVGEKARYSQIIENLVSNGIKYRNTNNENMFVKIKVADNNENVTINIEDNGIGIPLRNQSEIFTMFKRFHPKIGSGSGLGLSIVKKHVDSLDGSIETTSSNNGTRFSIVIPKTTR